MYRFDKRLNRVGQAEDLFLHLLPVHRRMHAPWTEEKERALLEHCAKQHRVSLDTLIAEMRKDFNDYDAQ